MLRNFPNLNPGASINQKTILLEMAKIGGGAPSTRWMVNLIACTLIIHPINILSGIKKIRGSCNPKKR